MRYSQDATYVNILCPYFTSETEKGLNCEGCLLGSKRVTTLFESVASKKTFIENYCYKYPNDCVIAKANDKKYE